MLDKFKSSTCINGELYQCVEHWYSSLESRYSVCTTRAYTSDLLSFFCFIQGHCGEIVTLKTLEALRIPDFRAWLSNRRSSGVATSSNLRALAALRAFFSFLGNFYGLTNQAVMSVRGGKVRRSLPRSLSEITAAAAVSNVEAISKQAWIGLRDRAALLTLYGCGIRIAEMVMIKLSDIRPAAEWDDSAVWSLSVIGKGNKERIVPLLNIVKLSIDQYMASCPYDLTGREIFVGARGKRLAPDVMRRSIRRLRREFGLPAYTTPHAFRHSFASQLLERGANLRIIQELLGHSSLSSTQIYTNVDVASMLKVYAACHPRGNNSDD